MLGRLIDDLCDAECFASANVRAVLAFLALFFSLFFRLHDSHVRQRESAMSCRHALHLVDFGGVGLGASGA